METPTVSVFPLAPASEYHGQGITDQIEAVLAGAPLSEPREGWQRHILTFDTASPRAIGVNTVMSIGLKSMRVQYMRDGTVQLYEVGKENPLPLFGSYYRDPENRTIHFIFDEKIPPETG